MDERYIDKRVSGQVPKYALLEIECRMIVQAELLPDLNDLPCKLIEDRYLDAGRLRLRKITAAGSTAIGATESTFKLCKKYGKQDGDNHGIIGGYEEPIVNIYLSAEEYESLRHLPGCDLIKRRYSYEFQGCCFSIDEHTDALTGLYLCECEATSAAALAQIVFPPFAVQDVTADPAYFGANLAGNYSPSK